MAFRSVTRLISLIFIQICVVSVLSEANFQRKLKTEFLGPSEDTDNYLSSNNQSFINVAYTRADGPHDTLHYVMSTRGVPSLLVARTDTSANITIDWKDFLSSNQTDIKKSIHFSGKTYYVYALIFTKLYEYNDINDQAQLPKHGNDTKYWRTHQFHDMGAWADSQDLSSTQDHLIMFRVYIKPKSVNDTKNASITFKMQAFNGTGNGPDLPHLQYTANTTQIDFIIDGMHPAFSKSRFALEMDFVTSDTSDTMQLNRTSSIDDEHTPGVFEEIEVTTRGLGQTSGAYLQWKPVCYKVAPWSMQGATRAHQYNLASVVDVRPYLGLAYAYFGDPSHYSENVTAKATNVSFGLTDDKFYTSTNYTAWSFTVGYGTPPSDRLSLMILLIITIGLGIPVVLILFGGVYIIIKKQRQRRGQSLLVNPPEGGYESIN